MIAWTKENNYQIERLDCLIKEFGYATANRKKALISEVEKILANKSLDLNNNMGETEIPLLITASIWNSKKIIKLLLEHGVDVNITYNPFVCYGNDYPTDYCQNKEVNSLDILQEARQNYFDILIHPETSLEVKNHFTEYLNNIDQCIKIIFNFGGKETKLI